MTDFMSRLRVQRITRERFRLPYSVDDVTKMLTAAVRYEVEYWGGGYVDDNADAIGDAARWLTAPNTPGLYISGTVGNGKTTLLYAIADTVNVMTNQLPRDEYGKAPWVSIVNASDLIRAARRDDDTLTEICRKPMLALDDLGSEQVEVRTYGNIVNPAVELLAYRYKMRLFTIVTTNLQPSEVRALYGDRIADRLNEMMTRITIKVTSYRIRNARKS